MLLDESGIRYFVIDDHTHMGERANPSLSYPGTGFDAVEMIEHMDACGIDMVVAFPRANPHTDYREQNELVLSYQEQHPDRIIAFARIQPFYRERAIADIAEFGARGVKGLKIHPLIDGGNYPINDPELMFPVAEAATRAGLACLVHSGSYWTCAPALIGDLASNFPDIPFIVGHTGMQDLHQEAIITARRVPNVYLDLSELMGPGIVRRVVREVGADRVMYGSDHPARPFGFELGKVVKYAELEPHELELVLGGNAARLYGVTPDMDRPTVPVSAL